MNESNLDRWSAFRETCSGATLRALKKVWYEKGKLTDEEERMLKTLFEQHPFGETNFYVWLRQTLRQIQENAAIEGRLSKETLKT